MKATEFLSNRTYVVLPRTSNPRVFLPFGDANTIMRAFELYNPFSKKAKILKRSSRFLCLYMKPLARILLPTVQGKKSKFLIYVEKKLDLELVSAVYCATAQDKLVLQLQQRSGIVGYLKFPITELGVERVLNEERAIRLLSKKKIIPPPLLTDDYSKIPFIILPNLNGTIGNVRKLNYQKVLESFKTGESFELRNHPRILNLIKSLQSMGLVELAIQLKQIISASSHQYELVYEHGDFAEWNLIYTDEGLVPFDFEYFEEMGLEHLDEIKFHFQKQYLLYHKRELALIRAVSSEIDIEEFNVIFKIFLLKEIAIKIREKKTIDLENKLMALVS